MMFYNPYLSRKKIGFFVSWKSVEEKFVIFSLLFCMNAVIPPGPLISVIRYTIFLFCFIYLLFQWQSTLRVAKGDIFLCSLIGIALLSQFWSVYPYKTFISLRGELLPMFSLGLYMAARFSIREQLKLLAWALAMAIVLGILVTVALPSIGFHSGDVHAGAWRGIFGHKNRAGAYVNLALITSLCFAIDHKGKRLSAWVGWISSFALVLATTSKTALGLSLALTGLILILKHMPKRSVKALIFLDFSILTLLLPISYLISNIGNILASQGRDLSLTGRLPVWENLIQYIQKRPFLGYGHDAFWSPGSELALEASIKGSYVPFAPIDVFANSHNGLLDLTIDLGLIGFFMLLSSLLTTFILATKTAYISKNTECLWPMAFVILLITNNMTESILTGSLNAVWVLWVAMSFSTKRSKKTLTV